MKNIFFTFLLASTFLLTPSARAGKEAGEWGDAVNGAARLKLEQKNASEEEIGTWLLVTSKSLNERAKSLELLHRQVRTFFAHAALDDESFHGLACQASAFWEKKAQKARNAHLYFEATSGKGEADSNEKEILKKYDLKIGRYVALLRKIEDLQKQISTAATAPTNPPETDQATEQAPQANISSLTLNLQKTQDELNRYVMLKYLSYVNQLSGLPLNSKFNFYNFKSYPEAIIADYFSLIQEVAKDYAHIYGKEVTREGFEAGFLAGVESCKKAAATTIPAEFNKRESPHSAIDNLFTLIRDQLDSQYVDKELKALNVLNQSANAAVAQVQALSPTSGQQGESFQALKKPDITINHMQDALSRHNPVNIVKEKMLKWASRVNDTPWDDHFPVRTLVALSQEDQAMIQHLPYALSMKDLKAALPQDGVPQSKFQEALKRDREKSICTKPEGDFEAKLASANETEKREILEKVLLKMVSYANLSYAQSANFEEAPTQEVKREPFKTGKALKWAGRLQKHGQDLIKELGLNTHIFYGFNDSKK